MRPADPERARRPVAGRGRSHLQCAAPDNRGEPRLGGQIFAASIGISSDEDVEAVGAGNTDEDGAEDRPRQRAATPRYVEAAERAAIPGPMT
jgi:hypothetical protein